MLNIILRAQQVLYQLSLFVIFFFGVVKQYYKVLYLKMITFFDHHKYAFKQGYITLVKIWQWLPKWALINAKLQWGIYGITGDIHVSTIWVASN